MVPLLELLTHASNTLLGLLLRLEQREMFITEPLELRLNHGGIQRSYGRDIYAALGKAADNHLDVINALIQTPDEIPLVQFRE